MQPDKGQIPAHWSFHEFTPAEIPTGCVRAHALGKTTGKITFFLGFKTRPREYNTPEIRALQRSGFEIDFIPLPDPGKQIGYLEDYKNIVRDAVAGNLPENGTSNHVPHFLFGHSLGARAIIAASQHEDSKKHINNKFTASHLRSPFRSKPLLNLGYSLYCKMFKDVSYPNGPLDHFFNKETHSSPLKKDDNAITHGQILYSNYETSDLINSLRSEYGNSPTDKWNIPTLMIGGEQDFVSDKDMIKLAADLIGATYIESKAGHNGFMECKETRGTAKEFMYDQYEKWLDIHYPARNSIITEGHLTYNQWEDPMVC